MAVEYLGAGGPDGIALGRSDDLVGFYGTTPAAQPSVTSDATTAFSQTTASSGIWGFQSSTAATNLVTQVQDIAAALKTLGLVAEG